MKFFVFLQPVNGIADLAQLAERKLPKLQVAGSSPVIRSRNWKLSSVGSERLPYKQEVAGSNPAVSTKKKDAFGHPFFVMEMKNHLIILRIIVFPLSVTPLMI